MWKQLVLLLALIISHNMASARTLLYSLSRFDLAYCDRWEAGSSEKGDYLNIYRISWGQYEFVNKSGVQSLECGELTIERAADDPSNWIESSLLNTDLVSNMSPQAFELYMLGHEQLGGCSINGLELYHMDNYQVTLYRAKTFNQLAAYYHKQLLNGSCAFPSFEGLSKVKKQQRESEKSDVQGYQEAAIVLGQHQQRLCELSDSEFRRIQSLGLSIVDLSVVLGAGDFPVEEKVCFSRKSLTTLIDIFGKEMKSHFEEIYSDELIGADEFISYYSNQMKKYPLKENYSSPIGGDQDIAFLEQHPEIFGEAIKKAGFCSDGTPCDIRRLVDGFVYLDAADGKNKSIPAQLYLASGIEFSVTELVKSGRYTIEELYTLGIGPQELLTGLTKSSRDNWGRATPDESHYPELRSLLIAHPEDFYKEKVTLPTIKKILNGDPSEMETIVKKYAELHYSNIGELTDISYGNMELYTLYHDYHYSFDDFRAQQISFNRIVSSFYQHLGKMELGKLLKEAGYSAVELKDNEYLDFNKRELMELGYERGSWR